MTLRCGLIFGYVANKKWTCRSYSRASQAGEWEIMLSMMNTSEQVGFSLVLGVGRIDNNNYMDICTATIRDVRDSFTMMGLRQSPRCSMF